MIAAERETVVTVDDESEVVRIYTAQRTVITKLRKYDAFTEVRSGVHDGTAWAEFTIPANQWNPATGMRRTYNLSDEQRAAARERLAAAREKGND